MCAVVRFLCAGTDKLIIAVLLGRDLDAERSFVPMNAPCSSAAS